MLYLAEFELCLLITHCALQVIKMLLTIIAIFFLCWGPRLILNVMFGHELSVVRTPAGYNTSVS